MRKTKQKRFAIVAILIFSMIAMYGGMPSVKAANMDSAKTTLSDSDLGATGTTTIEFELAARDLVADEYVEVAYEAGEFGLGSIDITCPANTTSSVVGDSVYCTVDAAQTLSSTTLQTITVANVVNPGTANDYSITVSAHLSGGAEIESSETKVYIIDDVTVSAHVAASLSFAVASTSNESTINGDTTTGTSTATELAFGTIQPDTEYIMGHQLTVSTNAQAGYSVTVQQDGNMVNAAGADINSFNTGAPLDFTANPPAGTLGDDTTYGHMGVSSDDSDLATAFGAGLYQGLNGTSPLEIMSHDGPADGLTQDAGLASVAYAIEITDLQEAGDYENTLTYVCTPTY